MQPAERLPERMATVKLQQMDTRTIPIGPVSMEVRLRLQTDPALEVVPGPIHRLNYRFQTDRKLHKIYQADKADSVLELPGPLRKDING